MNKKDLLTESLVNALHDECKITESVDWSYYKKFKDILDKYMSNSGEGETFASQIVTAINKLVYKWYNDGDVYDNVCSRLEGWENDLSSYANWLYRYVDGAKEILSEICDLTDDSDYEDLLQQLADEYLNEDFLSQASKSKTQGSIYNCDGPFKFSEYNEQDEEDYDDDEYLDSMDESKELKKEDYTAREHFDASMKRYLDNGGERSIDDITVLVETDNFLLAGSRDEERPTMIHLDVWTGSYDSVEVFIDQDYKGKVISAKANWSAIGSAGVEETEDFMNHLKDALDFIKQIDGKDFSSEIK